MSADDFAEMLSRGRQVQRRYDDLRNVLNWLAGFYRRDRAVPTEVLLLLLGLEDLDGVLEALNQGDGDPVAMLRRLAQAGGELGA